MENEQVVIYIDGGSRGNPGPSALGLVAYLPNGKKIEANGFLGKKTNNHAEYKALIYALFLAKQQGWRNILVKSDSLLLVKQIRGEYQVKSLELAELFDKVMYYLAGVNRIYQNDGPYFDEFHIVHIPREENKEADKQVNICLDKIEKDGVVNEPEFI